MKEFKNFPYIVAAILAVGILALRIFFAQSEILEKAENDISNGLAIVVNQETRVCLRHETILRLKKPHSSQISL